MELVKTVNEVREKVKEWKKQGLTVGLVPTMGFLHEGHASLIKKSSEQNDKTVVSVFVNPIQFAPGEDFESYPRDIERDKQVCTDNGADLIFNPDADEMYKGMFLTSVEVKDMPKELCGKTRPTHFKGVCTVVLKLLNIVTPDRAYFGEKDAQQLAIVKRMAADLNVDTEIIGCPIIREADGLAKSSRNTYLNNEERKAAVVISKALSWGHKMVNDGERDTKKIKDKICSMISAEPLARVDYVDVVYLDSMKPTDKIDAPILCAAAVYIGKTRLIDNFSFTPNERGI